jgi:hypothetical protein
MLKKEQEAYRVGPISTEPDAQAQRGWEIKINGQQIDDPVETIVFQNSRMGISVTYGQRPEGFDGLVIEEVGGGGYSTAPYYIYEGELYVGVLEEIRLTCTDGQERPVLNVPRGFLNPEETHFEKAAVGLKQEVGYCTLGKELKDLGNPTNMNSAWFVTGEGKGVKFFAVHVQDEEILISKESDTPEDREFIFDQSILKPRTKLGEKILGSKFIHWTRAIDVEDVFTLTAVARLLKETSGERNKV